MQVLCSRLDQCNTHQAHALITLVGSDVRYELHLEVYMCYEQTLVRVTYAVLLATKQCDVLSKALEASD